MRDRQRTGQFPVILAEADLARGERVGLAIGRRLIRSRRLRLQWPEPCALNLSRGIPAHYEVQGGLRPVHGDGNCDGIANVTRLRQVLALRPAQGAEELGDLRRVSLQRDSLLHFRRELRVERLVLSRQHHLQRLARTLFRRLRNGKLRGRQKDHCQGPRHPIF